MIDVGYEQTCIKKTIDMLEGYKANKIAVQMLALDLQMMEAMLADGWGYTENMAISYDQMSSSKTNRVSSVVEEALIEIESKRQRVKQQMAFLGNQTSKIELAADNLPEPQRTLIKLKYLEKLSWQQICQRSSFSEDYVRKELKNSAIKMMAGYLFLELHDVGLFAD